MKITLDLDLIKRLNLTPSLYCHLYTLYFILKPTLTDEQQEIANKMLETGGWLSFDKEGYPILTEKSNELFKTVTETNENVEDWIEEWRGLFPKGVKSGNRRVRGDKQGVLKKMRAFLNANPKITKEQIFEATKQYVFESGLGSYKFMVCADYFINKNGSSMLAAAIEDIEENGSSVSTNANGDSNWHKEI